MKINRSAFLLFAGAIAGSACFVTGSGDDDDDPSTSGSGGEAQGGGAQGSGGYGVGGAGVGGGVGGGACDDSIGDPDDCAAALTACSEGAQDQFLCDIAKSYFKPKVAESAVACILALDETATCDAVLDCRTQALAGACADPTADDLCADLITTCDSAGHPTSSEQCRALVDGLNAQGRQAVSDQCGPTSEGLCFGGLEACIDTLF